MNRSIAKTRNQLERITLKINQLKTKYTAQNYNPLTPPHPQSSPTRNYIHSQPQPQPQQQLQPYSISMQNNKKSTGKSNNTKVLGNNFMEPVCSGGVNLRQDRADRQEEDYQKEFKIFRNQIYAYLERVVGLAKDRGGEDQGFAKKLVDDRIRKIQEQTTNCLSNVQDVVVLIKKNQKLFNDRLTTLQSKLPTSSPSCQLAIKLSQSYQQLLEANQSLSSSFECQNLQLAQIVETVAKIRDQDRNQDREKMKEKEKEKEKDFGDARIYKKIGEELRILEDKLEQKFNALQDDQEKYSKFNVELERQVYEMNDSLQKQICAIVENMQIINSKLQQNQSNNPEPLQPLQPRLESLQHQLQLLKNPSQLQKKLASSLSSSLSTLLTPIQKSQQQLKTQLASLQETVQKNCQDISSVAEEILILSAQAQDLMGAVKEIADIRARIVAEGGVEVEMEMGRVGGKLAELVEAVEGLRGVLRAVWDRVGEEAQAVANMGNILATIDFSILQDLSTNPNPLHSPSPSPRKPSNPHPSPNPQQSWQQAQQNIRMGIVADLTKGLLGDITELRTRLTRVQTHSEQIFSQLSHNIDRSVGLAAVGIESRILASVNVGNGVGDVGRLEDLERQVSNLSEIQDNMKQLLSQQLQKFQHKLDRLEKVENNNQSSIAKTSTTTQQVQSVDEKLNQFQSDINETIKLLYEDIEAKVNEMLAANVESVKSDIQAIKQEIQANKKLFSLLQSQSPPASSQSPSPSQLLTLKQQTSLQIANQVNRLSNILQHTIQQLQLKIQKLDNNFSYLYQRMSKLEFDNASFKDQLVGGAGGAGGVGAVEAGGVAARQALSALDDERCQKKESGHGHGYGESQAQEESSQGCRSIRTVQERNNILDILGQLGTSTNHSHFFE